MANTYTCMYMWYTYAGAPDVCVQNFLFSVWFVSPEKIKD